MRKSFKKLLPVFLAFAMVSLSGCGASASKYASSVTTAETAAVAVPERYEMAVQDFEAAAPMEEAGYGALAAPGALAASGTTNGSSADSAGLSSSSSTVSQNQPASRKLIRTVNLNVETDTFDDLLKHLQEQISGLEGYIEQSDVSGHSMQRRSQNSGRYASITARIPSDRLDQFITVVEGSGNVTYRSESTNDVTLQYSDLESRKKSLTIEQDRIWELLEKADTLEAVITLEERLSEIRYELESMESKLRLYDNQVTYSTVYLNIDEVVAFTPVEPETIGQQIKREFLENAKSVGDALTDLIVSLITTSPVWVPLLIIVLIFVRIIRRRKRISSSIRHAASQNPLMPSYDESSSDTASDADKQK